MCDPPGIDCFQKLQIDKKSCLIPCEGIFTDTWKEKFEEVTEDSPGMKNIFKDYENYKNQFIEDLDYPISISGTEYPQEFLKKKT